MSTTVFFRNLIPDNPNVPSHLRFDRGVAYFSGNRWWYAGTNFSGSPTPVPIPRSDISVLKAWILTTFSDQNPQESTYVPGTAYRRIVWPQSTPCSLYKLIDEATVTQSFTALKLLLAKMQDLFEYIEPVPANADAYGHKVRELLLLAAMEVEASWAAVLKVNGYVRAKASTKSHLNTQDYVKLLKPMLLDSYDLRLKSYPDLPAFAPFRGWNEQAPTQSLGWYGAYNLTKHNREEFLKSATLEHAIQAVCAATIMFYAQFGYNFRTGDERMPFLKNLFQLGVDHARHETFWYIPDMTNTGQASGEWNLQDYPFSP